MADRPETPAYQQVAEDLRAQIRAGVYPVGQQLPSLTDLTERYSTSITVIRMALRELRGEGIISTRQGKGAFVQAVPESDAKPEHTSEFQIIMRQLGILQAQVQRIETRLEELEQDRADDGTPSQTPPSPASS